MSFGMFERPGVEFTDDLLRFGQLLPRPAAEIHVVVKEVAEFRHGLHDPGGHGDPLKAAGQAGLDGVHDQPIDPRGRPLAESADDVRRDLVLGNDPRPDGVVKVVIDIGDDIGDANDLAFKGGRHVLGAFTQNLAPSLGMADDAVADLPGQEKPFAVVLELLDDPQALLGVAEAAFDEAVERGLSRMPEGRVAEVVPERDGFGQVLVEAQGPGDCPGDLRDLESVGQACPVVIAEGREKDLGFMLQTAEGFRMDDPIAVALKGGPD